ncbi:hypothetical protein FRACYDRAFT_246438 [Fragilariopsis cylindrus CCMP1102]|uniref:Uncharacterized protein n=1 Tax=Fragilariopsis cylindrus CCMP1102 TaxID=635003 RepID=A0A1E7EXX8_9STRA|nr:hypothetical protein FRACYDRAFT_246438 [Fragilariopsis cylindrus CCMP1102]|eukprot:OEU10684.1 hypothetical protein FRACYDRAFT_246438 [Fragilariopsis cylindrus CCMP1102]
MFRYGEKALAYAHGFLDSSKKEPFGKRIDDLLNHIMDKISLPEAEAEGKRSARKVARQQDTNCRNKTSSFESASFKDRGWSQELDLQAATLCIQSISAHQQDLAKTRRRYHGDMMVAQDQHARLVKEREQSIKLVEI